MPKVPKIVMTTRQPEDILDSPLGLDLRACEERITKGEHDGLLARWEFGRHLLRCREGKQLPKGLLATLVTKHGISRSEIQRRIQFAETFTTKEEVSHACSTYRTWRQVTSKALPKKPPATKRPQGNVIRLRPEFRQWRSRLAEMASHPDDLTEADLKELDRLQEAIADLFDARNQTARKASAR